MNLELSNANLLENSEISEQFSNATAKKCRNLLARYAKAVKKGKANKEARLLNKTLKKCPDVKQSEIDAIDKLAPSGDLNPSDESKSENTFLTTAVLAEAGLPSVAPAAIDQRSTAEEELPLPEKKFLGMKPAIGIPVLIVGIITLAIVGYVVVKKLKK